MHNRTAVNNRYSFNCCLNCWLFTNTVSDSSKSNVHASYMIKYIIGLCYSAGQAHSCCFFFLYFMKVLMCKKMPISFRASSPFFLSGASALITVWHNQIARELGVYKTVHFIDEELFWRETRRGDYYNDHEVTGHPPAVIFYW